MPTKTGTSMTRIFCMAAVLLIGTELFSQQSRQGVLVDTPALRFKAYKPGKTFVAPKPQVQPKPHMDTARYQHANELGYVYALPDGMPLLEPYSDTSKNIMLGTGSPKLLPITQAAPAWRMPNALQQRKLVLEKPDGPGNGK